MATCTFDETHADLLVVCKIAQNGLYDLGRIRGKNDLQSAEELRQHVLTTSKALLAALPCLQLEDDAIEEMDSKYSHMLTQLARKWVDDKEA
jgi:hypothetical protein